MNNNTLKNDLFVTDTMALVIYLEKRKIPSSIKEIFENVHTGSVNIIIPGIVLAEILYLSERNRIQLDIDTIRQYIEQNSSFIVRGVDLDIVYQTSMIKDIPELHDRLIAATAMVYNAPLLTNDPIITKSAGVQTIW